MESMALVIMEKDKDTGFLEKVLGSYSINEDTNLVDRIFAVSEGENRIVFMYITVPGDFKDWEFNAILDNYNTELYGDSVLNIEEDEEGYNPTWLIKLDFMENDSVMEEKINQILEIHKSEAERVLGEIKNLESEYNS